MTGSEPDQIRPVALVTGGSRGIGAAIACRLAADGYDVVITYASNQAAADDVVAECTRRGATAIAVRADLRDSAAVELVYAEVDARFGRLDLLVNNAGILPPAGRVADFDADRLLTTLSVNTIAPALCAAAAVRRMDGRGGVIVNVSSRAAVRGGAGEFVDYAMSKSALDTLTVGLAEEVARAGVRVVGVRPGLIETELNTSRPGRLERLVPTVPMGRTGSADEVAAAVCWLASAEASYITGVTLDVSGGR